MSPNPALGVVMHWLGGLACASFYVPYKKVRQWAWETIWLAGGVFSWILAPWVFAVVNTRNLFQVLASTPSATLGWCWTWGFLWGFGGLTFGLAVRYLGISLGTAIVAGLTMIIGTLAPPAFHGVIGSLFSTSGGPLTFAGIGFALLGVAMVGAAGHTKLTPHQMPIEARGVDSDFRRGILLAVFSGVLSSCFAFGLDAGQPIRALSGAAGTTVVHQGLPVLCVVLAGGFATNFLWCLALSIRNRTSRQFLGVVRPGDVAEDAQQPLLRNYMLCALGGIAWYLQFFFYTMGESQMGPYGFTSWTLHMASIIIFSSGWGFYLGEWKRLAPGSQRMLLCGVLVLVAATIIIGAGNYLNREA